MGGLCSCMFRMFCCDCTLCEPRDDWNIENEAREGERGAGWIYKKAKGNDLVWSKRYFVITNEKLMYFTERDRLVMKGEIVLAGALAAVSTTRADSKKCFYFTISHPQCGSRDFYAKTRNRRNQWMTKINDISAELTSRSMTGKLQKQGGLGKNVWQERWCICTGTTLDYFDSPTDNQSKGSLNVLGATIKAVNIKDKFAFELSTAQPGKKGNKKYVFASDKEHERDQWVEMLTKASTNSFNLPPLPASSNATLSVDSASGNPMHLQTISNTIGDGDEENGIALQHMSISSTRSSAQANELAGYLLKKSPSMMKGWQKRYFKTLSNGDIAYYKSEEDAKADSSEEKGVIRLKDIISPNGVEINESTNEFTIKLVQKKVNLKAKDLDEAVEWVRNIEGWIQKRFTNTSID